MKPKLQLNQNPHANWYETGMPHIWLPYAQMQTVTPPLPVVATEGCRIKLADGRELIDGIASWWSACHGYNHPHIVAAMKAQLDVMPHVMFGGLTHEPALKLAHRLASLTGMPHVFFGDSGSVAVEVALKMALGYWHNLGKPGKTRFVCFKNGYHGDTTGAMSVSDPEDSMHKTYAGTLVKQYVLDIPEGMDDFARFDATLAGIHHETAALIIEPLVQGAGGMLFHSAETLAGIHRICKKYGVLFIADEIATGFGRTGSMFACDEAGIRPDIMCLGKALTGGAITLAATLASEEVYAAFLSDDPEKALMHGPTYMANPLACSAANASLDLFETEPRLKQVKAIEAQLRQGLEPCRTLPHVVDVRVKGAIGVVQMAPGFIHKDKMRQEFVARGVWIRPFGDIIYLMPAFTISDEELETLASSVVLALSMES